MDDFMEAWIDLGGEMLLCLGALAIMFSINAAVTTAVVLPLVAIVTLTDRLTGRIQRLRAASREAGAQVAGFIAEACGAVQTLQVAAAEDRVVAHLDALNAARQRAALSDRLLSAVMDGLAANIAGVGMGLVLLLAAGAMRRGAFSVGDFALFASYVGLAGGGPRWIGRLLARRRQAEVSIGRMQTLMRGAEPLALTGQASREPDSVYAAPLQTLTVRGLGYRYTGSERGIADIDFTLATGGFTVITGPVGAGKTTLLRCLLGLAPSESGEIRWNGEVVADPANFMVPPRCAYTPQAPRLFSETVRDNIGLGHVASDAEIALAVEQAVLDGDLARLGGLDTLVGARGVTLSGGQIQRVAAARMFVRGTELMVFDDLSSALDVETEQRLWRRLKNRGDQTILSVSHRPEAFRRADQILVMDHGRIVARGNYEALLAGGRLFARPGGDGL